MADAAPAAAAAPLEGAELEQHLAKLEAFVAEQGNIVKTLKKAKAPKEEIAEAVAELKKRKEVLAKATPKQFDPAPLEDLLKRRFFYAPSFEIYGGVAGFYDYGPTGCAVKSNVISEWRKHFIINDGLFEIDCPAMTPKVVLDASGHVERFADIMVRDEKTGECIRADHLLEDVMKVRQKDAKLTPEQKEEARLIEARADEYSKEELQEIFGKFDIKSYAGNSLTTPEDFNMMFATQIGPSGKEPAFLRPETAQGIFLAYKRLYEFNNARLPFGGAQIGVAYRNEISPRGGLLRVREFQMAEIEYFVDPEKKDTPKFASVADIVVPLLDQKSQMAGTPIQKRGLGDAVADGTIANETLGYFIGRIYEFLATIGVDVAGRLRFRQHLPNEMAHYACDCWDAELKTSHGWIECVGCADRSAYDLDAHTKATKIKLEAAVQLPEPIVSEVTVVEPNKKVCGKHFKRDNKLVCEALAALSTEAAEAVDAKLQAGEPAQLEADGRAFELTAELVKVVRKTVKVNERKFTPSVIEPSFGIGRIIYCLLEHCYDCREPDAKKIEDRRSYLKLVPKVAPVKCSLLPLSNNEPEFDEPCRVLQLELNKLGVSNRVDLSGASIGKRYARTDEIAIPFGIVIDFQTKDDQQVTLRERDTMQQVRVPIADMPLLVAELAEGKRVWPDVVGQYGLCVTGGGDGPAGK